MTSAALGRESKARLWVQGLPLGQTAASKSFNKPLPLTNPSPNPPPFLPCLPHSNSQVDISLNGTNELLLPSGENAVPPLFLGKGVDVFDLLVTASTRQGVAYFNASQVGFSRRRLCCLY